MSTIVHLVAAADWEALAPAQPLQPASIETEGFIHCTSGDALMLRVANSFYRHLPGEFLALSIDQALVVAEIKWEHPPGSDPHASEAFPHIYGPLNTNAVVAVRSFSRADDGSFLTIVDEPS